MHITQGSHAGAWEPGWFVETSDKNCWYWGKFKLNSDVDIAVSGLKM